MNDTPLESRVRPKRGTIGYEVRKLVKRYGSYTIGHHILQEAIIEACGMRSSDLVTIGGKLVHETPGAIRVRAAEEEIYAKLKSEGVIQ